MAESGYAGQILKVNLSDSITTKLPSAPYVDRFVGGRGIALKLYWDLVPPETGAMEPENCLICATGPVTGFFGFAGCRWVICGKSPSRQPEAFSYGNLGGRWGPALKYAGYDAISVQGRAEKPVYLYITLVLRLLIPSGYYLQSAFPAVNCYNLSGNEPGSV